jgi:hypothetical protein
MIEAFCVDCGHGESDGDVIREDANGTTQSSIDATPSDTVQTVLQCKVCDKREIIDNGSLAVEQSTGFDLRECPNGEQLSVSIDSQEVDFTDIDEQVATSVHYTSAGVRSSARVHLVHIYAVNPPTLSKGWHTVEVADSVDAEMMLAEIDYRDENHRTLKFQRDLTEENRQITENSGEEVV